MFDKVKKAFVTDNKAKAQKETKKGAYSACAYLTALNTYGIVAEIESMGHGQAVIFRFKATDKRKAEVEILAATLDGRTEHETETETTK